MKAKVLDVLYEMHKLICIAKDHGAGEYFNMEDWRRNGTGLNSSACSYHKASDCGTHGCLLGTIAFYADYLDSFIAPTNFPDCWAEGSQDGTIGPYLYFVAYKEKLMGEILDLTINDLPDNSSPYDCNFVADFLFGALWATRPQWNTIEHAIERLEVVISAVESGEKKNRELDWEVK